MHHLKVLGAVVSVLAITSAVALVTSGCGGSSNAAVSGPPVGSGIVTYQLTNSFSSAGTTPGTFTYPAGIALSANGNVNICDYGNGEVEVFGPTGVYLTEMGSEGTGPGQLESPSDVATFGGNFYIVDRAANAVLEYNSSYVYVKNLTTTAPGGFNKPTSITIDPSGNIYVGQSGAVLAFNSAGTYTGEITSVGGTPLPTNIVAGLAADPNGNLYLLDPSSQQKIDLVTPAGAIVSSYTVAGVPYVIRTDGNGNVFYTDLTNNDIQEYSSAGVLASTVATSITSQGMWVTPADVVYTAVGTSPGGYVAVYTATNPTAAVKKR